VLLYDAQPATDWRADFLSFLEAEQPILPILISPALGALMREEVVDCGGYDLARQPFRRTRSDDFSHEVEGVTSDNAAATATLQKSATFSTNQAGKTIQQVLGLIESSFGFDLEVIALLSDGSIQHFWRSAGNLQWYPGPVFGSTH
jgi:hypothetical protein